MKNISSKKQQQNSTSNNIINFKIDNVTFQFIKVDCRDVFYLGTTEVTQGQWRIVMGTSIEEQRNQVNHNGTLNGETDNHPIYYISWNEAINFCQKLNAAGIAPQGWKFTLPTEEQWEYAAMGGLKGHGCLYSGSQSIDDVCWYGNNSMGYTQPVATKMPNELGFYDMSGNVYEWCLDDYPEKGGFFRICRGGAWCNNAENCSVVSSEFFPPNNASGFIGFRLAIVQVND